MEGRRSVRPTAEEVITKLKDDGDFDNLRLQIIRTVKQNEELKNKIISEVKQSEIFNQDGSDILKPSQLSDAVYQELGKKIMGQISDDVWKIIRSESTKNDIRSTVESVYERIVNPKPEKPSPSPTKESNREPDKSTTNELSTQTDKSNANELKVDTNDDDKENGDEKPPGLGMPVINNDNVDRSPGFSKDGCTNIVQPDEPIVQNNYQFRCPRFQPKLIHRQVTLNITVHVTSASPTSASTVKLSFFSASFVAGCIPSISSIWS